jgi:hypothetical protein
VTEDARPEPPYPADVRAKGWRFQLDYERIEQSGTWNEAGSLALDGLPLARPLLLATWYAAWKQVPCGSLPTDDRELAGCIGLPRRVFSEYREILLRGWCEASDGRLYHPTITQMVVEMMTQRRSDADRVARWREVQAAKKAAAAAAKERGTKADVTRNTESCNALPTREYGVSTTPEPINTLLTTFVGVSSENGSQLETDADQPAPEGASSTSQAQSTPRATSRKIPPCRYDEIVKAYHEVLPELPAVRLMDEKRQRSMRKLWMWVFMTKLSDGRPRATTHDEAVAWFRTYFDRARESDFLMGRTPRARGHEGWKCTLDYLMSDRGLKHVVEGLQ